MRLLFALILVFSAALFQVNPALSQQVGEALVVGACGTPGRTYTAGSIGALTVDTTGTLCGGAATLGTVTVGTFGTPSSQVLSVQGGTGMTPVATSADPCSYAAKSSVPISVSTATTTSLVAVSGATAVYVCGFSISIAASATTATTAQFEYGTGASCTGTHALTGTYGSNDAAVSTTPTVIDYGTGSATVFTAPASNGVCIVTAGNAVFTQGVLTYVQQ